MYAPFFAALALGASLTGVTARPIAAEHDGFITVNVNDLLKVSANPGDLIGIGPQVNNKRSPGGVNTEGQRLDPFGKTFVNKWGPKSKRDVGELVRFPLPISQLGKIPGRSGISIGPAIDTSIVEKRIVCGTEGGIPCSEGGSVDLNDPYAWLSTSLKGKRDAEEELERRVVCGTEGGIPCPEGGSVDPNDPYAWLSTSLKEKRDAEGELEKRTVCGTEGGIKCPGPNDPPIGGPLRLSSWDKA